MKKGFSDAGARAKLLEKVDEAKDSAESFEKLTETDPDYRKQKQNAVLGKPSTYDKIKAQKVKNMEDIYRALEALEALDADEDED